MYLIIGLGNPGIKYEYTRHNLGFLTAKCLANKFKIKFKRSSLTSGWAAETRIKNEKVYVLLPSTFMNNSGIAVRKFIQKKDIDLKNILVVCDDFNLDFGQIRLRQKGSDGGHNGLCSIIEQMNSNDFARLRLGIGHPSKGKDPADFVLEEFIKKEKELLKDFVSEAAECCLIFLEKGINKAMEKFNRRKEDGK